jgi:hypothetical protein
MGQWDSRLMGSDLTSVDGKQSAAVVEDPSVPELYELPWPLPLAGFASLKML